MTAKTAPRIEIDPWSLLERSPDGVLLVTAEGTIRFANPAAESMFGGTKGSLIGKSFGHPVGAEEAPLIKVIDADGNLRTAELRVSEAEWDGRPASLVSLRDITDLETMQLEAQQASRLASVGQFVDATTLVWMAGLFSAAFGLGARPLIRAQTQDCN